jgi:large subunit ribosomal protein L25
MNKAVRVSIEVKMEGKPIGLAEGGLLNVVNRQIEIECLPADIPDSFTVDVSNMGVGDAIHVSDMQIPEKFKLISPPDLTLVVVNLQEEEVVAAPTAVDAAAAGAAPAAGAAAAAPAAAGAAPAKAAAAPAKDAKAPAAKK